MRPGQASSSPLPDHEDAAHDSDSDADEDDNEEFPEYDDEEFADWEDGAGNEDELQNFPVALELEGNLDEENIEHEEVDVNAEGLELEEHNPDAAPLALNESTLG